MEVILREKDTKEKYSMCCLIEPEWETECIEGPDSVTGVLKVLEPDAGKLARPVLRGGSHGNVTFLPDKTLRNERGSRRLSLV